MNGMDLELLGSLPPEALQQLLGMGTLDERGDLLQQQLLQAQALQNPTSGDHSTGMGAALGGLGDVFRSVGGGMQQNKAQGQQLDILGKKDAGRAAFARAASDYLRSQQAQQDMMQMKGQANRLGQQLPVPETTQGLPPSYWYGF